MKNENRKTVSSLSMALDTVIGAGQERTDRQESVCVPQRFPGTDAAERLMTAALRRTGNNFATGNWQLAQVQVKSNGQTSEGRGLKDADNGCGDSS